MGRTVDRLAHAADPYDGALTVLRADEVPCRVPDGPGKSRSQSFSGEARAAPLISTLTRTARALRSTLESIATPCSVKA